LPTYLCLFDASCVLCSSQHQGGRLPFLFVLITNFYIYEKCPMCAEEVQDDAKICKHCWYDFVKQAAKWEKKPKEISGKKSFLIIMIVVIGIWWMISKWEENTQQAPITSWSCDSTMKEAVANEYKSPSTVKFISCSWDKSTWIFWEADAQNKLWWIVRTTFLCKGDSCLIQEK